MVSKAAARTPRAASPPGDAAAAGGRLWPRATALETRWEAPVGNRSRGRVSVASPADRSARATARPSSRVAASTQPMRRGHSVDVAPALPPSPPQLCKADGMVRACCPQYQHCTLGGGELEISRVGRTYQGLAGVIRLEQGRSGIS